MEGPARWASISGTAASSSCSISLRERSPFLLKLAADLKAAKYAGYEQQRMRGKNIAVIFEKTSTRTRVAFEVAAYDQGAHVTYLGPSGTQIGSQGIDEGHGPRPRPDLRRHRVPRLRPGDRRGAGGVRRRPGLERADRRVPPDADPRRRPDHDGVHATSRCPRSRSATWATPATTWATRSWSAAAKLGMDVRLCAPKALWPEDELVADLPRASPTTRARGSP